MARVTKAVHEQRVDQMVDLLCDGYSRYKIIQIVTNELKWNIIPRAVDWYIKEATDKIKESVNINIEEEREKAIKRYARLYRKYRDTEPPTAVKCLERLDKLKGLEAPIKVEGTVNHTVSLVEAAKNNPEIKDRLHNLAEAIRLGRSNVTAGDPASN